MSVALWFGRAWLGFAAGVSLFARRPTSLLTWNCLVPGWFGPRRSPIYSTFVDSLLIRGIVFLSGETPILTVLLIVRERQGLGQVALLSWYVWLFEIVFLGGTHPYLVESLPILLRRCCDFWSFSFRESILMPFLISWARLVLSSELSSFGPCWWLRERLSCHWTTRPVWAL